MFTRLSKFSAKGHFRSAAVMHAFVGVYMYVCMYYTCKCMRTCIVARSSAFRALYVFEYCSFAMWLLFLSLVGVYRYLYIIGMECVRDISIGQDGMCVVRICLNNRKFAGN